MPLIARVETIGPSIGEAICTVMDRSPSVAPIWIRREPVVRIQIEWLAAARNLGVGDLVIVHEVRHPNGNVTYVAQV